MHPFYPVPKIQNKQVNEAIRLLEDYLTTHQQDLEYNFYNLENSNFSGVATGAASFPIATHEKAGAVKPTAQFVIGPDGSLSIVIANSLLPGIVKPDEDFTVLQDGTMSINEDKFLNSELIQKIKYMLGITQGHVNIIVLDNRDILASDLMGLNSLFIQINKTTPVVTNPTTGTSAFLVSKMWYEYAKDNPVGIIPSGITLTPNPLKVYQYDASKITVAYTPPNATEKSLTWISDNPSIATVKNGVVTGVNIGKCVVTATTVNGIKASCNVEVLPNEYSWIENFDSLDGWTGQDNGTFTADGMLNIAKFPISGQSADVIYKKVPTTTSKNYEITLKFTSYVKKLNKEDQIELKIAGMFGPNYDNYSWFISIAIKCNWYGTNENKQYTYVEVGNNKYPQLTAEYNPMFNNSDIIVKFVENNGVNSVYVNGEDLTSQLAYTSVPNYPLYQIRANTLLYCQNTDDVDVKCDYIAYKELY